MKPTSIILIWVISSLAAPAPSTVSISDIAILTPPTFTPTIPNTSASTSITPTFNTPALNTTTSPSPSPILKIHTPQITNPPETLTARFITHVLLTAGQGQYKLTFIAAITTTTALHYPLMEGDLRVANGTGESGMVNEILITEVRRTEIVVRDMGVQGDVDVVGDVVRGSRRPVYTNNSLSGSSAELPTNSTTKTTTTSKPCKSTSLHPLQTFLNTPNPSSPRYTPSTNKLALLSLIEDNTRRNANAERDEYKNSLLDNIISHLNAVDAGNLRCAVNGEPDLDKGSDTDDDTERSSSEDGDERSGSGSDDNRQLCGTYRRLNLSLNEDHDRTSDSDSHSDSNPPPGADNSSKLQKDLDTSIRSNAKYDESPKERDTRCTCTCTSQQNSSPEPSSLEGKLGKSREEGNKLYMSASQCCSYHCGNNQRLVSTGLNSHADVDLDKDTDINIEIHLSGIDKELLDEFRGIRGNAKSCSSFSSFSSDNDDDHNDERSEEEKDAHVSLKEISPNKRPRGGGGGTFDVCYCGFVIEGGFGGDMDMDMDSGIDIAVHGGKRRKIVD